MPIELKKNRNKVVRISVSLAIGNEYVAGTNFNLTVYDEDPEEVFSRIQKLMEEWSNGNDMCKPE